jgi:GDSL-like Lipase/Acylhydrolase family
MQARMSAEPEFVYLLGDSHVRSFSNDPGFVPLFIGSGKQVRWTDDQFAQRAARRLSENLARVPREAPVVLVFGEPDVRFTLAETAGPSIDADAVRAKLVACVERRIEAMKPRLRERPGMTAVYGCVPTANAETNRFVRFYNARLGVACAELGVPFIDISMHPICTYDGSARPEYVADDFHLNPKIVPIVRAALHRFGMEPATPPCGFAWSDFLRFPVGDADTRIWGDAALDSGSTAYAASELRRQAAAAVAAVADRTEARTLLVINAREGHVPLAMAPRKGRVIFALEASPLRRRLMRVVLAVAERHDVHIWEPGMYAEPAPDIVVDLFRDGDARFPSADAATIVARFLFLMPDVASATADFPSLGLSESSSVTIRVETKSGSHGARLRFGCRTAGDRALVEDVASRALLPAGSILD